MVEALCLKSGGRGFDSRLGHYFSVSAPNPFSRIMAPGFTQPVIEMSTGRFLGVKCGRHVRLTT
jgi:hypothetical protein